MLSEFIPLKFTPPPIRTVRVYVVRVPQVYIPKFIPSGFTTIYFSQVYVVRLPPPPFVKVYSHHKHINCTLGKLG